MSALTAIDVVLEPGEALRERAIALNAALRQGAPGGFAFDESHTPHVTLVQRYVRADELEQVFAAAEEIVSSENSGALRLRAVGLVAGEFGTPPGTVLASVVIEPLPALLRLHGSLVRALAPFARPGGTAAAFFTGADEQEVNDATVAYVDGFVPAHSGDRYEPHMSVGVGEVGRVRELSSGPFEVLESPAASAGVFRLGNLGTARQALRRWRF